MKNKTLKRTKEQRIDTFQNKIRSRELEVGSTAFDEKIDEWQEKIKDLETGNKRFIVLVKKADKTFWYRKLVGKKVEVREFTKSDYKVVDTSMRIKKGLIDNCGFIFVDDCEILRRVSIS